MKQIQTIPLSFDIDFNTLTDTQNTGVIPYSTGFLSGWIQANLTAGVLEEMYVGWKVQQRSGSSYADLDDCFRPIFIDTNRAADNYDTPNYVNMYNSGAGILLADAGWYPFILFNPATPRPFPLLKGNDRLQFLLTGVGLTNPDVFQINLNLLNEEERR